MNAKKVVSWLVFADFVALNVYALWLDGYSGFLNYLTEMPLWGWVILTDLVIALSMVLVWLWRDAKASGRNPLGYTALTFALGSVGTLLYVVLGKDRRASA